MFSELESSKDHISRVIGENIRQLRENAQISRRDLARLMGISYQQLYKYERGQNRISAEMIVYLKFCLKTNYNEFFKGLF